LDFTIDEENAAAGTVHGWLFLRRALAGQVSRRT
jgi:hypothetical protein